MTAIREPNTDNTSAVHGADARRRFHGRPLSRLSALGVVLGIAACAGPNEVAFEMLLEQFRPAQAFSGGQLNPAFNYIRVTVNDSPSLLVNGQMPRSLAASGQVESLWYSAGREVLGFRQGRVVRALGVPVELHRTDAMFPAWDSVASGQSVQYVRTRDLAGASRYGQQENVSLTRLSSPAKPAQWVAMPGVPDPAALVWFEEQRVPTPHAGTHFGRGKPARYAVDLSIQPARVWYSEQCLSDSLCLVVQVLPSAKGAGHAG